MARKNYPGSLDRRGSTFRWRVHIGGGYQSFTVQTTDRKEAERFARERYRELEKQAARSAAGLATGARLSDLLHQFETEELPTLAPGTQRSYRDSIGPIREYFIEQHKDPKLDQVHAKHIRAYLGWRRVNRRNGKSPLSGRTLAKDRAVLHRMFNLAERMELREGNPVARVQPPKYDGRDPVLLTEEQYAALLRECENGRSPMLALYALVLGETGTRCHSEALWLKWEDVDLQEGFIWIASGRDGHRTKSGKGRWIPMTQQLRNAMRDHFARFRFATYGEKQTEWVFHNTRSRLRARAGERIASMRHAFDRAAERAKLPSDFHRHDLRHRRTTTLLADGHSPVLVKEMLGHADLRTTMGYTHLAREHLRQLVLSEPSLRAGAVT